MMCSVRFLFFLYIFLRTTHGITGDEGTSHHVSEAIDVSDRHGSIDFHEMPPPDDEDFPDPLSAKGFVATLHYASGDGNTGDAGYESYDSSYEVDYDLDPFLLPKSILSMIYDGSAPLKKTWPYYGLEIEDEDSTVVTVTNYLVEDTTSPFSDDTPVLVEELKADSVDVALPVQTTAFSDNRTSSRDPKRTESVIENLTTQAPAYNDVETIPTLVGDIHNLLQVSGRTESPNADLTTQAPGYGYSDGKTTTFSAVISSSKVQVDVEKLTTHTTEYIEKTTAFADILSSSIFSERTESESHEELAAQELKYGELQTTAYDEIQVLSGIPERPESTTRVLINSHTYPPVVAQENVDFFFEAETTPPVSDLLSIQDSNRISASRKLNEEGSGNQDENENSDKVGSGDVTDEDTPGGRSIFSEADVVFDRCLVSPYPCRAGENCNWNGNKVVCTAGNSHPRNQPCDSQSCVNGGICRGEGGVPRCDCPVGFSGLRCEIPASPCIPNPCLGDCRCRESCRHEFGYYCQSDGGYTGKNCTIPLPRVSCEPSRMRVDVPSRLVHEFDHEAGNAVVYASPEALSSAQRSPQCRALQMTGDFEIVISLPFDECGTASDQARDTGGGRVFKNKIWLDRQGVGFDMPVPILDFECTYERQYSIVTSLAPIFNSPQLLGENGRFSADVQLCKVRACPGDCPSESVVQYGAVYTVGELIHLSVSSRYMPSASDAVMSIDNLLISCDPKMESSTLHLIKDGCHTPSGIFVESRAGTKACVTFQTPRVLSCKTTYLHVHVNLCPAHKIKICSSGLQTCWKQKKRKKRGVIESRMYSVVGPLTIFNGNKGDAKFELFPGANSKHTTPAHTNNENVPPIQAEKPDENFVDGSNAIWSHPVAFVVYFFLACILFVVALKCSLCPSEGAPIHDEI